MINLKFSITGSEKLQVTLQLSSKSDYEIKSIIKDQLHIPQEDAIDIFDESYCLVEGLKDAFLSQRVEEQVYKICILNKLWQNSTTLSVNSTEKETLYKDTVSKKKYACINAKCRKTFDNCSDLFQHYQVHYKDKPFRCQYHNWGKSFMSQSQLNTHLSVHQDLKPFKCTFPGCEKSYAKNCRLKVHLRSHNGIKPFLWPYEGCGKRFSEKGNMKTHIRTHTGEKPYFCTFWNCKKRFSTQGHLIDHFRSHSDTKPFPCTLCPKAFMRASTLKVHMRDHTGERPFKCDSWGKSFKEARSLRSHTKIHSKVETENKESENIQTKVRSEPKVEVLRPTYKQISSVNGGFSSMNTSDYTSFEAFTSSLDGFQNLTRKTGTNSEFINPMTPVTFPTTKLFNGNFDLSTYWLCDWEKQLGGWNNGQGKLELHILYGLVT